MPGVPVISMKPRVCFMCSSRLDSSLEESETKISFGLISFRNGVVFQIIISLDHGLSILIREPDSPVRGIGVFIGIEFSKSCYGLDPPHRSRGYPACRRDI